MPETSPRAPGDAVIEAHTLTKRFSASVLAVDDLTFDVERGQVCGMLGPNGAGKTTTLRMLVGLIHPTAGDARVLGARGCDQVSPSWRVSARSSKAPRSCPISAA